MHTTTTLRRLFDNALSGEGESWDDVRALDLPYAGALDIPFEIAHDGPNAPGPATLWTDHRVYRTDCEEGRDGIVAVPRHPAAPIDLERLLYHPALNTVCDGAGTPMDAQALTLEIDGLAAELHARRRLDPERALEYRATLAALDELDAGVAGRANAPAFDHAHVELQAHAQDLRALLARLMRDQDVCGRPSREIARDLTRAQARALALAVTGEVTVGQEMTAQTARVLCERGLLQPRLKAEPGYVVTWLGEEVARHLPS